MKDFDFLIQSLQSTDSKIVEDAAIKLAKLTNHKAIPYLLNILSTTDNSNIRNTVAMILGDMKANEAVPILISLINDPSNLNNRGTLIYALQSLDCSAIVADLSRIICNGNFESREMALQIIEELKPDATLTKLEESLDILSNCLKKQKSNNSSSKSIIYIKRAASILESFK